MQVNHALVADFLSHNFENMSLNAIRENKILTEISEFTVYLADQVPGVQTGQTPGILK